jgi:hypothetical protein
VGRPCYTGYRMKKSPNDICGDCGALRIFHTQRVPGPGFAVCKSFVVAHQTGPLAGILPGDVVRVIYHGAPTSLLVITKVKEFSIEGKDGEYPCKITLVGSELRFYGPIINNVQSVLRNVRLVKEVK